MQKICFHLLFVLILSFVACSQNDNGKSHRIDESKIEKLVELPDNLREVSGFSHAGEGLIWAHNDSGSDPELHLISQSSKDLIRTVRIRNAVSKDWEELADDETHTYIGDFGNNAGVRKDLKIYKVEKAKLDTSDSVDAQIISFYYPEQTEYGYDGHNYDCEAMISVGDSLYLFTKNRGNRQTDLYTLPKIPGRYSARLIDHFDSEGLLTAADFQREEKMLILMGYNYSSGKFKPFIWVFEDIEGTRFFENGGKRFDFPFYKQTEALCFVKPGVILFTEEEENNEEAYLMRLSISDLLIGINIDD